MRAGGWTDGRADKQQTTNKQQTNHKQTTNKQQTNNKQTTNKQQTNNKQTTNKQLAPPSAPLAPSHPIPSHDINLFIVIDVVVTTRYAFGSARGATGRPATGRPAPGW